MTQEEFSKKEFIIQWWLTEEEYMWYTLKGYEIFANEWVIKFYLDGKLHCEDGPAVIWNDDNRGWEFWLNGEQVDENEVPYISHVKYDLQIHEPEINIIDKYVISNNLHEMNFSVFKSIVCVTFPTWRSEQLLGSMFHEDEGVSNYQKYINYSPKRYNL